MSLTVEYLHGRWVPVGTLVIGRDRWMSLRRNMMGIWEFVYFKSNHRENGDHE
jgi:hypothetical protein